MTLGELRRIVKEKFLEFKDVKDPRVRLGSGHMHSSQALATKPNSLLPMQVVDLLIFKGREELETYLMMHKQRHHLVSDYHAGQLAYLWSILLVA